MLSWLKTLSMDPRFREDDVYEYVADLNCCIPSPQVQLFRHACHFSIELRAEMS
jgi:hypothetical protein